MCSKEANGNALSTKMEKKQPENSFWKINKDMLPFKLHYFLFIGALGCALPFTAVVARNRIGLSATSLAAVLTVQQLITIVTKPILGYISDYFNRLKLMIMVLIILQTVFYFILLVIPPINKTSTLTSVYNSTLNHIENQDPNSELVALRIQACETYSFSLNRTNEYNMKHSEQNEFICRLKSNASKLLCRKTFLTKDADKIFFQTNISYCCSYFTTTLKNFTNTFLNESTHLFYLSSNESNISSHKTNNTYYCSYNLFEDDNPRTLDIQATSQFATLEFWIFAIIYISAGICLSSTFTLSDTACQESVQKYNSDFGRQRLYGAVGWGIMAPIGGLLCDVTNDFYATWIVMMALQILALWNLSRLDLLKPHFSENILKDVRTVLKSVEFTAFELGVFMNGFGAGIMWFYLIWFLTSMGGSKFLLGLVQYVECFGGELPLMFFSGWIIKRVGHFNLLSVSLLCYGIRFLWYSYLQNPWLVLPVEFLHGFTYGTFYPAVASYGKISAKPGTEATTQSILFTTHEGLGAGLGCIAGGIGFDYLGGHMTFFYLSIFSFVGCIINFTNTNLLKRREKIYKIPINRPKT